MDKNFDLKIHNILDAIKNMELQHYYYYPFIGLTYENWDDEHKCQFADECSSILSTKYDADSIAKILNENELTESDADKIYDVLDDISYVISNDIFFERCALFKKYVDELATKLKTVQPVVNINSDEYIGCVDIVSKYSLSKISLQPYIIEILFHEYGYDYMRYTTIKEVIDNLTDNDKTDVIDNISLIVYQLIEDIDCFIKWRNEVSNIFGKSKEEVHINIHDQDFIAVML